MKKFITGLFYQLANRYRNSNSDLLFENLYLRHSLSVFGVLFPIISVSFFQISASDSYIVLRHSISESRPLIYIIF